MPETETLNLPLLPLSTGVVLPQMVVTLALETAEARDAADGAIAGDRRILLVVSFLSGACGVSFALCGLVLLLQGQWVLGAAPDNWAERLNSVVAVACMTGLGALTLSLHHLQE